MDIQDIRRGANTLSDYIARGGGNLDVIAAQIGLLQDRLAAIRQAQEATQETVTQLNGK